MLSQLARLEHVAALRARVDGVTSFGADHGCLPFGLASLDEKLSGGGISIGGLHEVTGASTSLSDDAAATLFVAGIAARFATSAGAPALWTTTSFDL